MKQLLIVIVCLLFIPAVASAIEIEAVICSAVEDREPVGEGSQFGSEVERVYFWTKVTGVETETTIRHVWLYKGEEIADVALTVKGSPWRTYSYKSMIPEWTGEWAVKVVGEDGDVIVTKTFIVTDKEAAKKLNAPKSAIEAKPVETKVTATEVKATPADSADKK
ncbi:MAG: DUF2914 domain-containing protein [candidate division Zixibacteria bacterium]|nr:DUF2914 domain-containing protein [candidate division Zixibacteria bacterium]